MRFWFQQAVLLFTGCLCVAVGALWTAVLFIASILGLSAIPDDAATTQTLLEKLFGWLLQQDPSAASFIASALLFLLGLFVLGYVWSRSAAHTASIADSPASDFRDARSRDVVTANTAHEQVRCEIVETYKEGAETDLMMFFLHYILPAVLAQKELQEVMVRKSCEDIVLQQFAARGLITKYPINEFWQSFSYLWGAFTSSPIEYVPLHEMMEHIDKIEKHYTVFVDQADEIACGVDYWDHPEFKRYWEDWNSKHVSLKEKYDATIKQDPRFPKLFRPGRESRWGDAIAHAES